VGRAADWEKRILEAETRVPGDAYGLSLAGNDGALALAFATTARTGLDAGTSGPAAVETSVAGSSVGAPVDLDADAEPYPAVSVDDRADMLAAPIRLGRSVVVWQNSAGAVQGAVTTP
jgi:hypothetical protein